MTVPLGQLGNLEQPLEKERIENEEGDEDESTQSEHLNNTIGITNVAGRWRASRKLRVLGDHSSSYFGQSSSKAEACKMHDLALINALGPQGARDAGLNSDLCPDWHDPEVSRLLEGTTPPAPGALARIMRLKDRNRKVADSKSGREEDEETEVVPRRGPKTPRSAAPPVDSPNAAAGAAATRPGPKSLLGPQHGHLMDSPQDTEEPQGAAAARGGPRGASASLRPLTTVAQRALSHVPSPTRAPSGAGGVEGPTPAVTSPWTRTSGLEGGTGPAPSPAPGLAPLGPGRIRPRKAARPTQAADVGMGPAEPRPVVERPASVKPGWSLLTGEARGSAGEASDVSSGGESELPVAKKKRNRSKPAHLVDSREPSEGLDGIVPPAGEPERTIGLSRCINEGRYRVARTLNGKLRIFGYTRTKKEGTVIHDLKLIEELGAASAREKGLNIDLHAHNDPRVVKLLRGTYKPISIKGVGTKGLPSKGHPRRGRGRPAGARVSRAPTEEGDTSLLPAPDAAQAAEEDDEGGVTAAATWNGAAAAAAGPAAVQAPPSAPAERPRRKRGRPRRAPAGSDEEAEEEEEDADEENEWVHPEERARAAKAAAVARPGPSAPAMAVIPFAQAKRGPGRPPKVMLASEAAVPAVGGGIVRSMDAELLRDPFEARRLMVVEAGVMGLGQEQKPVVAAAAASGRGEVLDQLMVAAEMLQSPADAPNGAAEPSSGMEAAAAGGRVPAAAAAGGAPWMSPQGLQLVNPAAMAMGLGMGMQPQVVMVPGPTGPMAVLMGGAGMYGQMGMGMGPYGFGLQGMMPAMLSMQGFQMGPQGPMVPQQQPQGAAKPRVSGGGSPGAAGGEEATEGQGLQLPSATEAAGPSGSAPALVSGVPQGPQGPLAVIGSPAVQGQAQALMISPSPLYANAPGTVLINPFPGAPPQPILAGVAPGFLPPAAAAGLELSAAGVVPQPRLVAAPPASPIATMVGAPLPFSPDSHAPGLHVPPVERLALSITPHNYLGVKSALGDAGPGGGAEGPADPSLAIGGGDGAASGDAEAATGHETAGADSLPVVQGVQHRSSVPVSVQIAATM